MIREQKFEAMPGLPMLLLFLVAAALEIAGFVNGVKRGVAAAGAGIGACAFVLTVFLSAGLFVVNPNEGRVLQLFGDYVGTVRIAGTALGEPVLHQEADLAARAELRERAAQGQRQRRQSRSRSPRSSSGRSSTPPRRSSRWTTTTTT